MSVYKPEGSDTYVYDFWRKGVRYAENGFLTHDDALQAETKKKAYLYEKELHPEIVDAKESDAITIAEIIEWYNKVWAPQNASIRQDLAHGKWFIDYFGNRRLKDIKYTHISALRNHLYTLNIGRDGGKPTDQTVNHYHSYLRRVINKAIKHYRLGEEETIKPINHNPAAEVSLKDIPDGRARYLYPEEERILGGYISNSVPKLYPYFVVGISTGVRLEGLTEVRVKEVSLLNGDIYISKAKNEKSYYAKLSSKLVEYVRSLMVGKGLDERLLGDWVPTTVSRRFHEAVHKCEFDDITFHSLRHTFAYKLLSAGTPIYVVSKLLNHSSVKITEKVYGHLDKKAHDGARQVIDETVTIHLPSPIKVPLNKSC